MIRAIHFSAISILAAASVIAATSAVSMDQPEAMSTMSLSGETIRAHGPEGKLTGSVPAGGEEAMPDARISVIAAFLGERGTGLPLSPNS